jgi:3-hydroxyisobutyrate dehydrogenase-like beta-hydroxyacid dehydrogenase
MTAVCLLGFGEVGQILAQDLRAQGVETLSSWDPKFLDAASGPRRAISATQTRAGTDMSNALVGADVVISAVTAAQTIDAARTAAATLQSGMTYVDLNSAAPAVKQQAAAIVQGSGAAYVEVAVIGPVPAKRIRTQMLLGGPKAKEFLPTLHRLGFAGASFYAVDYGKASAVKMCRSVIVKGMEAILTESMLSARRYGVDADVLDSLSAMFSTNDWKQLAHYMIGRSVEHGARRAEEMRDAALTVADARIVPVMTNACVARQEWAAQFKDTLKHAEFGAFLDAIIAQNDKQKNAGQ